MDLVRWEPFDGFTKMQSRINSLFDEVFDRANGHSQAYSGVWAPPVDILESRDSYLIRAELPGMKKEEISVEFKEGALTLSGEKKFEEPAEGVTYHRSERASGKFARSFYLPQTIKQDGINATFRDGILEVHVPKADEAKPKQIAISVN
jgi:HSP20 family protein